MSSAHTPGPWMAIDWNCHAPTTIVSDYCGSRTVIAECSGNGRAIADSLADARLIAAAPELLDAVRNLVYSAKHVIEAEGHYFGDEEIVRYEALIAKATGAES